MHSSADIDLKNKNKKPEIFFFHNANKEGVDCVDKIALLYTRRSATRRWPVAVWGNILDIAAINSWMLFKKVRKKRA